MLFQSFLEITPNALIRSRDWGLIFPKGWVGRGAEARRRGAGTAPQGDRGTVLSLTGEKGFLGAEDLFFFPFQD